MISAIFLKLLAITLLLRAYAIKNQTAGPADYALRPPAIPHFYEIYHAGQAKNALLLLT